MKTRRLVLLSGVLAPLVLTGHSPAEFVGLQTELIVESPGCTYRVYALFDNPGADEMLAVIGTPENPLSVFDIGGGTFFQHELGGDTAPQNALIVAFPSLAWDTFVTIGVESWGPPNGQPADLTMLTPMWPGFGAGSLTVLNGGWYVTPGTPQADPFDPVASFPGNGRILLAQFSYVTGCIPDGDLILQYRSDGVIEQRAVEFTADWVRCDTPDVFCINHPCFGSSVCDGSLCMDIVYPTPDCNDNLVLDSCEIDFGSSLDLNGNGIPDECDPPCPWDCADGDGTVNIVDFLALLAQWGQGGTSCDIDGDGVGITDFLELLANWGPCP